MSLERYRELTSLYDQFIYESYHVEEIDGMLMLYFQYKVVGEFGDTVVFTHRVSYELHSEKTALVSGDLRQYDALIFTIGLVEAINYYKTICPGEFYIKCGRLSKEQKVWWQKLFYHGLGEFIYLNGLAQEVTQKSFVHFADDERMPNDYDRVTLPVLGNLIPVGGGKDSVVTLELLKGMQKENLPFVMSPPEAAYDCIRVAGYDDYLLAKRYFDQRMIEMNSQGFLNGHVPFSAILGFIALFGAALTGKRYIPLSNERSANEATVLGESYNHQYSKSYEFEKDFNDYVEAYLVEDIRYFSFLRPLYEVEIAERFAKYTAYHPIFRSCNRGKKENAWCGVCSKCLFVYTILAPYMDEKALVDIFGKNLLEDDTLAPIMAELLGLTEVKPFECVGTVDEVRWSLKKVLSHYKARKMALPALVAYFEKNVDVDTVGELEKGGVEHMIPTSYLALLEDH